MRSRLPRCISQLPAMDRYRGICFIDTPGLDSVFEHNTNASLEWLPTRRGVGRGGRRPAPLPCDIELIRNLSRFTPNISVLLTKVDTLAPAKRTQVESFVRGQLARYWDASVPLFAFPSGPASSICASNSTSVSFRPPARVRTSNTPRSCGTRPGRCWLNAAAISTSR